MNSRFPQRDVTHRTGGPAVNAAGDGLEGAYSAVVFEAPSGGTCKVTIPALDLTGWRTATCSAAFTASVDDPVLVMFDENKHPWVISPTGANASQINGVTVPLTGSAWHAPTLVNSWVNNSSSLNLAGYLKDPLGFVHLRGSITGGATGTVAFVLPPGYRPGGVTFQALPTATGGTPPITAASIEVFSNGNAIISWTPGVFVGLDSVAPFLAEN